MRQNYLYSTIRSITNEVERHAVMGKTSYIITGDTDPFSRNQMIVFTNDEKIYALKKMLPDCDVSYEEKWVDKIERGRVVPNTKVLEAGITIDWS